MNPEVIIPTLDAIPIPAPIWLLWVLHHLTFTAHILAMNVMLSSAVVSAILRFRSKSPDDHAARFYRKLVANLPTLIAMTVTLGIAPLLFVQVLYGQFVYTSSVAIGWFWFLVIPLLIIAYYAFYNLKFKALNSLMGSALLPWIGALILIWISFVYSNNFNLSVQPERFTELLTEDTKGWSLNVADPSTFPRWLHFLLSAFAIGGVWYMHLGKNQDKHDPAYGRYIRNMGYGMFSMITMINIIVGFLFMITLRKDVMMKLMGVGMLETLLWVVGLLTAIGAILTLKQTVEVVSKKFLNIGTTLILITVVLMIILRDRVRVAYLNEYFSLSSLDVDPMWGVITVFLVLFVLSLGIMYWMIRTFYKAQDS